MIANVLTDDQIQHIRNIPGVKAAYAALDSRATVSFTAALGPDIKSSVKNNLGLDISALSDVPMRWIKGNMPAHVDVGKSDFTDSYLVFLTDSEGQFVIDGAPNPITKGTGYKFAEGLEHEISNCGQDAKLLLGPMSEKGFAVGESPLIINLTASDITSTSVKLTWEYTGVDPATPSDFTVTNSGSVVFSGSSPNTFYVIVQNLTPGTSYIFDVYYQEIGPYPISVTTSMPCYAEGTKILTTRGYVRIEDLQQNDNIVTTRTLQKPYILSLRKQTSSPISWKLQFTVNEMTDATRPICIKAGAFGTNSPFQDLFVSPDHRILLNNRLIAAKQLINGTTIVRDESCTEVRYYHLALNKHSVILANGLTAESYIGPMISNNTVKTRSPY